VLGLTGAAASGVAQKSRGGSAWKNVRTCNGEAGRSGHVPYVYLCCTVRLLCAREIFC